MITGSPCYRCTKHVPLDEGYHCEFASLCDYCLRTSNEVEKILAKFEADHAEMMEKRRKPNATPIL